MADYFKILKQKLADKDQLIGRERYKITSVLIPFVKIQDKCHLLFQIRSQHIPQPGEVCFPGGKFDPNQDKDTKDTALRETVEELGIPHKKISYVGKLGHYAAPMGVLVDAYVGYLEIDTLNELQLNKVEVERIFTLPLEYLKKNPPDVYSVNIKVEPYQNKNGENKLLLPYKKLGLPRRYEKPWGNIGHRIFVYDTDPVIWGITGELIYDFMKII
ncbi:MAG: NUDIX hydrolase [Fidelibacterota bacterium]